jgi:hypothetical protein
MMNQAVKNSKKQRRQRNEYKRKKGTDGVSQIQTVLRKNDVIMDLFAGSGTIKDGQKNNKVNIIPLKNFASELPDGPLKSILLSELEQEMDANTFIARFPIWMKLARMKAK